MALKHQFSITPRFSTRARALIVDSHNTTRNILASHLRRLGVGQVVQCARAQEALRQIEACGFDLILCEHRLADGTLGQDLIEDLRRTALLSLRTVVMVISNDATYNTVAEIAESAVDGFLIRPYSPGSLEDRMMRAYQRKDALSPVFDAIEAGRHEEALLRCETLHRQRAPYWTYAARLGAELALRLDRPALASKFFESVLAVKAVPWARLGIARTLAAAGAAGEALSTIENLLATEPQYVDAYDVLGKLHAEQGNLEAALTAYRQASEITPASVQRAQKFGIVAYYAGKPEVARAALERAAGMGAQSRHFDAQTLLLLALLHHRQGQDAPLRDCLTRIEAALAAAVGDSPEAVLMRRRLQRFTLTVQALDLSLQGQGEAARQQAVALAQGLEQPEFDIEAATNLLSLLTELQAAGVPLGEDAHWLRQTGLRFCISRHATEVLAQACQAHPPYVAALRQAHSEIGEMAQDALSQALAGEPQRAVELLLQHTEATRNAKLLHSAQATLDRYRDRIEDVRTLHTRCAALAQWGAARDAAAEAPAPAAPVAATA